MKYKYRILFYFTMFFFVACKQGLTKRENNTFSVNTPIYKAGGYNLEGDSLNIEVINNLVNFSVFSKSGTLLYKHTQPSVSDIQRWFFLIDSSSNIWLNSSDRGLYVLNHSENMYRLLNWDNNDDSILEKKLFNELPDSTKNLFGKQVINHYK